jgi:hypothetical protein
MRCHPLFNLPDQQFNMKKACLLLSLQLFSLFVFSQEIKYTSANNNWNSDSLGNHRAIVSFRGSGNVARVIIPWRRRDVDPWNKRVFVVDASNNSKVENVRPGISNNEKIELWFEPTTGKGDYYVYYMPYKNEGRSNYPKGTYLAPELAGTISWLGSISDKVPVNTVVKEIQSINALNSFYPMEVTATVKETASLISRSGRTDFIVFPEDRMNPIKMTDRLPYLWIKKGIQNSFAGQASRGEYYTYQLGIYALQHLEELTVHFTDLKNEKGNAIPSAAISCFNTSGIDYA